MTAQQTKYQLADLVDKAIRIIADDDNSKSEVERRREALLVLDKLKKDIFKLL